MAEEMLVSGKLPERIMGVTRANQIVDGLPKTSLELSQKFYEKALKYNLKK
ncbi:hypothetical protein [Flavobacterium sp. N502540]|uniref:hypothetical protein n=1 Tax=Flavobacterium sp. N502540 TaxID=2986838 RepID=UPI002224956C|nr:hypothetical protein [Flavobacterium sp. N502540]